MAERQIDLGLVQREWLELLERVEALYGETDARVIARRCVELVALLTGADRVMFAVTDHPSGRCTAAFWPEDTDLPKFMPDYERNWRLNPIGNRYASTGRCDTARLADCISRPQLERSAFFHEYLRPAQVTDCMTMYMPPTDGYRLAVSALRDAGTFTEVERGRMELLRGHITRAFRMSITLGRVTGRPVRARDLLDNTDLPGGYVIRGPADPKELPGARPTEVPAGQTSGGETWPDRRRLSKREVEVLHWICSGKTNPEIAVILGCSPRTVQKHVEHVLRKLEVPNRAAAGIEAVRLGWYRAM